MVTLAWILLALAMIATLAIGLRGLVARDARTIRAYGFACVALALAVVAIGAIAYVGAMTSAFEGVANVDPSRKATLLAQAISEAMNTVAWIAMSVLVPLATSVALFVRSARAASQS